MEMTARRGAESKKILMRISSDTNLREVRPQKSHLMHERVHCHRMMSADCIGTWRRAQGLLRICAGTTKGTNAMTYMMTFSIVTLAISGFAIVSVWKA
jgi:hypothetical protein